MINGVDNRSFSFFAEKAVIECGMGDTTRLSQSTELVIGQITRMITKGAAIAMTAHDGCAGNLQGIIETLLISMGEVHHQAIAVHFLYNFFTKLTDAIVSVAAAGRIANIIIAIMTKRDINNAALGEIFYVLNIMSQCETVFNAKHYASTTLTLVFIKILWRTGNTEITAVTSDNIFYFIKNGIGIGCGGDGAGDWAFVDGCIQLVSTFCEKLSPILGCGK